MSGKTNTASTHLQSVIHQYNNFGHSGAMGPNSVGTINYQQQWDAILDELDLETLAEEIGLAIKETAHSTSADYHQFALLAEAKEHAGKKKKASSCRPSQKWEKMRFLYSQKPVQKCLFII